MLRALLTMISLFGPLEDVDNPEFSRWGAYEPGTSVTLKLVNETHKMVITTTTTLKSRSGKGLVLESRSSMIVAGKKIDQPASTRTVPPKIKKLEPRGEAPRPKTGEEKVKVAGKEYVCTWIETTIDVPGHKTVSKVWTADAIPGGLVKMEATTTGKNPMKVAQMLVKFEVK